ncbi:hypothetical protein ACE6H2_010699 [Prunus campanulata]
MSLSTTTAPPPLQDRLLSIQLEPLCHHFIRSTPQHRLLICLVYHQIDRHQATITSP